VQLLKSLAPALQPLLENPATKQASLTKVSAQ
jgi:hypothetical protein